MKEIDVTWRGTWGVGDFMWALNCCHMHAHRNNLIINLEFHWSHEEDHLHHFEEEETIIDRLNYIHHFYHNKDRVKVSHKFKATSAEDRYWGQPFGWSEPNKTRFWFSDGTFSDEPNATIPPNDWFFRKDIVRDNPYYSKKKVVVWRPLFNAQEPRTWKRLLTNDGWDGIIELLRQAGLHVVELTYRTPVSEAMFHITTCRQVICYDGMWHYIAKNAAIPMTIVSEEGITTYHTPNALKLSHDSNSERGRLKNRNIHYYKHRLKKLFGDSKERAVIYYNKFKFIYGEDK